MNSPTPLTIHSRRDEIAAYVAAKFKPRSVLKFILESLCRFRPDEEGSSDDDDDRSRVYKPKPVANMLWSEVERMFGPPVTQPDADLFRTSYASGLRSSESLGLAGVDLDPDSPTLLIRGGKGDVDRYVMTDPGTMDILRSRPAQSLTEPIFPGISKNTVWNRFYSWTEVLGTRAKYKALKLRLSPHCLRHAFATHLYERGVDPFVIQFLLGHSDFISTGWYVHGTLPLWRTRYLASHPLASPEPRRVLPGGGGVAAPPARVRASEIFRDEVVAFILGTLPVDATLEEAIAALCQLQYDKLAPYQREWAEELGAELTTEQHVRGERLPLILAKSEIHRILDSPQDLLERLALRVLYASGVTDLELLDLTYADFNPQELSLRIAPHDRKELRFTVIDPETAALLGAYQADQPLADKIFPMGPDILQLAIERWGAATGILDRFRGMNRRACTRMFRNAFASHCLERGMDVMTLKVLLGHEFHATSFQYLKTSVERYRSVFESCHPLTADPS